ncbi:MAG: hypothetical protein Fur0037_17450 [Planctomycetota bacterium]
MDRFRFSPVLLAFFLAAPLARAQVAGVQATLRAEHELVPANGDVAVVLDLDVQEDADLPNQLLSGVVLDVKIGDNEGPRIRDGRGGTTRVAAGTKIERRIAVPVARALSDGGREVVHLSLTWPGIPGASCVVRVVPDPSSYSVDDLDLAKTRVVLATNMGDMTLAFRPDKAPNHVRNFIELSRTGFYDGTKFHRVIRNFMIQGGDPNTQDDSKAALWGQGGSGKTLDAEFNDIRHVRGVLSMARSSDPNSASSQFFIVHKDSPHLDRQYTAFGNLEKGADVLDAIATTKCGQGDRPLSPVILEHAVVLPVFK